MKKLVKSFFMALVAAAATSAMAAPSVVTFTTVHGLTYADGTPVLKGEIVALCWSPTSTFGGLTLANGEIAAKVDGEKVLSAKSGVKIDKDGSSYVEKSWFVNQDGGYYFAYVLDTRTSATELGTYATVLNGATETAVVKIGDITEAVNVPASTDYGVTKYVTSTASLTVTNTPEGPVVQAVGLSPIVNYVIVSGDKLGEFATTTTPFSAYNNVSEATIKFDGSKAKFFQLLQAE